MSTTKNKLLIKDSIIEGAEKGLFAKKMFHKGDIVCEYAGEIKDKMEMVDFYQRDQESYTKLHRFIRDFDEDYVIIGDPKLAAIDLMKSGVFVNDGACLDLTIKYDPNVHKELISNYITQSKQKQNVEAVVQDGKLYYIAIKRIKKGDEIYGHYGKHYWLLLSGIPVEQLYEY